MLVGADHRLLHVPLPVPVTLNTLCLPPSPANFPDTRHYHWAKPHELFETLPCTQSQIVPSCQWDWPGKMCFFPLSGLPQPIEAALRNNAAIYTLKPRWAARKQAWSMRGSTGCL